jgi:2-methylisocitrate lyase-like PEP mutase family enzyme
MTSLQAESADLFRRLHQDGLLILPNAWDAGSARLIESRGAKALATTSAGVAWSQGYPDGGGLPVSLLRATVAGIVRVIRVPLSADIEDGYSDDPVVVGETVAAVLDAGAIGVNIEDGGGSPDLLCAKIEQARRAGARLGVGLFVNARTDVYLRSLAPKERRVEETLARAERYRAAGADGIFVPGLSEPAEIRAVSGAARLPLNVMAWRGLPPAAELEALGVRRLSAGAGLVEVAYAKAASLAVEFLKTGASNPVSAEAKSYTELNALMAERAAQ